MAYFIYLICLTLAMTKDNMGNKSSKLEKLCTGLMVVAGLASFVPIPLTVLGFKEVVTKAGTTYAIRKSEERTVLVNNLGNGHFLEYRVDENNDGVLDEHYFRSILPGSRVGSFGTSKSVTEEDQRIYREIMNIK